MKVTREIKTGVVAIVVIILFIWGYNFLKDQNLYDTSRMMYAEYDNVQGLAPKSPITINGLKVGSVTQISFHPTKKGILVAHLQIDNPIEFSVNSIAQIYSPDFISGKSLKINLVMDEGMIARSGDTLVGEVDSGIMGMINEQIAPLQVKVESWVEGALSISAPLTHNHNIHGTGFAGSQYALAALCGWGAITLRMAELEGTHSRGELSHAADH